ncbi:MAG TPA: hypothetical protein VM450_17010 [Thermomicrobiales bacterium]|nr:hypothetical protein [Thermomicrobiales bacterium]
MRKLLVVLSVVAIIMVGLAVRQPVASAVQGDAPSDLSGHPAVGTWVVTVVDAPEAAPSLMMLLSDGIVLDASPAGHTGAGSWEATGERSATVTFVYVNEDAGGRYLATAVVRASIEVDDSGDSLTAHYAVTVVAPDGKVLSSNEGTASGVRVPVESEESGGTSLTGYPTVPAATPGP